MAITLRQLGITCGSFLSIMAVLTFVTPLLKSDSPPWGGTARAETAQASINNLQNKLESTNRTMLFLQQGFWTREMITAQEELRKNPRSTAARQNIVNAQQQLDRLRSELSK